MGACLWAQDYLQRRIGIDEKANLIDNLYEDLEVEEDADE